MSNSISFTCDCCGREVGGCNIVNGMKFCAKCYQETFGFEPKYVDMLNKESSDLLVCLLAEKDKQIAELQKQLEEKDKIIQMQQNIERCDIGEMLTENTKLRQQLKAQPAEIVEKIKEQLIKRLNTIAGYGRMTTDELSFFIETEFGSDLDTILKEYGGNNENRN